jgi:uncharacterized membrane protein
MSEQGRIAVQLLSGVAVLGTGVAAGIFYAFSSFVMAALGRLPAEQATAAMRSINVTVINASFMLVFLGTAVLSLALAAALVFWVSAPRGSLAIAACCIYLLGVFGVTMVCNVPLNDRLMALSGEALESFWPVYLLRWTWWNHVRTAAAVVSCGLLVWSGGGSGRPT